MVKTIKDYTLLRKSQEFVCQMLRHVSPANLGFSDLDAWSCVGTKFLFWEAKCDNPNAHFPWQQKNGLEQLLRNLEGNAILAIVKHPDLRGWDENDVTPYIDSGTVQYRWSQDGAIKHTAWIRIDPTEMEFVTRAFREWGASDNGVSLWNYLVSHAV